jgi:hypothetical protein
MSVILSSISLRGILGTCPDMEFILQPTCQASGSALLITCGSSGAFLLRLLSELAQGRDTLFWRRGAEAGEVEETRHAKAVPM